MNHSAAVRLDVYFGSMRFITMAPALVILLHVYVQEFERERNNLLMPL